jgi:imidazolonepropionase-like amidohydrolase
MVVSTRAISLVGGQFDRLPVEGQSLVRQEYVEISGVEEARKAVRQAFFDGADCIKIIVDVGVRMMSVEEIRAIVDEVHRVDRGGIRRAARGGTRGFGFGDPVGFGGRRGFD